jgi:hypothetical protein
MNSVTNFIPIMMYYWSSVISSWILFVKEATDNLCDARKTDKPIHAYINCVIKSIKLTNFTAWQAKQSPFRNASPLYLHSTEIYLLSMAVIHSVAIVNWLLYRSVDAFIYFNEIQSPIHVSLHRINQRQFYGHTTQTTFTATLHSCSHEQRFATVNCPTKTTRSAQSTSLLYQSSYEERETTTLSLLPSHRLHRTPLRVDEYSPNVSYHFVLK